MSKLRTAGMIASAISALALLGAAPVWAQEATTSETEATDAAATGAAPAATADLMSAEDLDKLLGPVALFPDTLLAQILMAATFPLDVVKADRFIAQSKDLSDDQRAEAAAKQDWDPSVQALAAGFPDIITRMAEHIDWTEQAGDAVLAQTDDVLDSIQRLRSEAQANGYLASNEAQVVAVENENISIAPANPEVVYVPTYEPDVVYSTMAPATSYVLADDDNWNDALAAGAIFFGSAIILNEIFDDNWGNDWNGPGRIDWDNADIDINRGDINRGDINIDRNNIDIDRNNIGNTIGSGNGNRIDRTNLEGNRIGSVDRDTLDRDRDRNFKPDTASRDAARAKIESRSAKGTGPAALPNAGAARDKAATRPAAKKPAANKPAIKPSGNRKPAAATRPAKVSPPKAASRPKAQRAPTKSTAFKQSGGSRAGAASSRGRASAGGGRRR